MLRSKVVDHANAALFPRPEPDQRNFLTPPEPLIKSPASGFTIMYSCSAANSSSDRYSSMRRVKSFVSTKVYTSQVYGNAGDTARPDYVGG